MNKKYVYLIIVALIAIIGMIAFLYNSYRNIPNNHENDPYNSTRTSQETNNTDSNTFENTINNTSTENNKSEENENQNNTEKNTTKEEIVPATKETEIASFTTKIYTKDSGRQKNITLACSSLNDTLVENGKTFSFSKTVGKATSSKGYKKADVFRNGNVIEALGGGLCQVSTTLYNAVLKVPNAKVTERHPHSNKVPYIKSGRDAAVSYGAQDFKFVNNTRKYFKN